MEDRRSAISVKATAEFKQWMDGLSARVGADVSTLVELGLRSLAAEVAFPSPPPRLERIRRRREAASSR